MKGNKVGIMTDSAPVQGNAIEAPTKMDFFPHQRYWTKEEYEKIPSVGTVEILWKDREKMVDLPAHPGLRNLLVNGWPFIDVPSPKDFGKSF